MSDDTLTLSGLKFFVARRFGRGRIFTGFNRIRNIPLQRTRHESGLLYDNTRDREHGDTGDNGEWFLHEKKVKNIGNIVAGVLSSCD